MHAYPFLLVVILSIISALKMTLFADAISFHDLLLHAVSGDYFTEHTCDAVLISSIAAARAGIYFIGMLSLMLYHQASRFISHIEVLPQLFRRLRCYHAIILYERRLRRNEMVTSRPP